MNISKLNEMIYKRKSVRKYKSDSLEYGDLEKIMTAIGELKPLYRDINVKIEIVQRSEVRSFMAWLPERAIVIYSEERDGYLENVGFMLAQLDLWLQSEGFGSCWVGIARMKNISEKINSDGMKYVIMLSVGYPNTAYRNGAEDYRRVSLDEISDNGDMRLEPARLAPSSVNTQPWYFVHGEGVIHVYQKLLARTAGFRRMNRIDVGIALAHMYVANPETFEFLKLDNAPEIKSCDYVGSIRI